MPAVTAAELTRADTGLGAGEIALLHTGWTDRMYGTFPTYFTQSPYLELEAARWLAARRPSAVVFDFFEEYMALAGLYFRRFHGAPRIARQWRSHCRGREESRRTQRSTGNSVLCAILQGDRKST